VEPIMFLMGLVRLNIWLLLAAAVAVMATHLAAEGELAVWSKGHLRLIQAMVCRS